MSNQGKDLDAKQIINIFIHNEIEFVNIILKSLEIYSPQIKSRSRSMNVDYDQIRIFKTANLISYNFTWKLQKHVEAALVVLVGWCHLPFTQSKGNDNF